MCCTKILNLLGFSILSIYCFILLILDFVHLMCFSHHCQKSSRQRESQEEEARSERPRIDGAKECGQSKSPTPNPKRMTVTPESPCESEQEEGGGAESHETKDEVGKAAKGEATSGPENEII